MHRSAPAAPVATAGPAPTAATAGSVAPPGQAAAVHDAGAAAHAAGPPGARARVDLGALAANYAQLVERAAPARVAAVVKANAYGLGLAPVAARLAAAGCRDFFVANLAEGLELRALQPHVRVFVLGGLPRGTAAAFLHAGLVPVLNAPAEVHEWLEHAPRAPAALQLDTGMTRAGLDERELAGLVATPGLVESLALELVMTHLACADEPAHPLNDAQLETFERLRARLPRVPTSIGNSAGTLLGPRWRGDLVRPGIALYGGRPFAAGPNPMREVVRLQGRVLQLRECADAVTVGYGATHRVRPPARIATVGVGYADGYLRALGGRACAVAAGRRVPVVGRVSMDLATLDVTSLPRDALAVGDWVDLLGGGIALEELAEAAGTIGYEILARLSLRLPRCYD